MDARLQEALGYMEAIPTASVSVVANDYDIPRTLLRSRLEGHMPMKGQLPHNLKLSPAEEQALCRYIDRLDSVNLAARPGFVREAANWLLYQRGESTKVSKSWGARFMRRHNYIKQRQRKIAADRQAAENVPIVNQYFQLLREAIQKHGVHQDDIWNMDETGFRIGVGKNAFVVTKRKRTHYLGLPENRESATAIEAISTKGNVIPAFLILTGQKHMAPWYKQALALKTKLAVLPTGYSNNELSLTWIKHFDEHTATGTTGAKRLLIIDGHGSHHTREFIQYCDDHDIIPFGLPPHLTHLLQPLDVVVFQPLKHYHSEALDIMVRDGLVNITKLEFLSCIEDVREQAFKSSTILSAFRKTGIHPYNPAIVLNSIAERVAQRTPSPQPLGSKASSTFQTPITLRQMDKIGSRLEEAIYNNPDFDEDMAYDIGRFVRGALTNTAELLQVKRDLGRTQLASELARRRRAYKNAPLKSGGVLTVAQGRKMVLQQEEDAVAKARRVIEAADQRNNRRLKTMYLDAAKEGRKWRMVGKISPAMVFEIGKEMRLLKRG